MSHHADPESQNEQRIHKQDSTRLAPGIHKDVTRPVWALISRRSTYALGVTQEGCVVNLCWGPRLTTLADLPDPSILSGRSSQDTTLTSALEEYPPFGGLRYGETVAKATFIDGVRDLDLRYEGYEMVESAARDGLPCLTLSLRDAVYPLLVTLSYQVDTKNDLIIRSATFSNQGTEPIHLERVFSAAWHLPRTYAPRILTTLAGQWANETQIQRHTLVASTTVVESKRGITSVNAMPWCAIEAESGNTIPTVEVYFATLAWSGSWTIRVTTDVSGYTTITGGISEHDFVWKLEAGTSFVTPDFIAGLADDGLNGARQRLHRYTRTVVLPQPQARTPRPVLYNSWEATGFDVYEAGQLELAERAARLGIELFVVDDGWFLRRTADTAGLGDWQADPHKFPHGLKPLVKRVKELGMQFGLWVEPEMVNPDSDLYRAHSDWVYSFPTRPRSEARNQLVLNLGRADVRAYLLEVLDALVSNYEIAYLKWDMNRPISEPGWMEYLEHGGEAREVWVRHTQGVYELMDALRTHHPHLTIESCASGGGRADLGILRRTDQVWASDNTHPEARLLIQEGFSLVLPARVMGAWVTDAGRGEVPIAFRFHVSMLGALGIGGNLLQWRLEELDEAVRWIAVYKMIRLLVQEGNQCWLLSPSINHGAVAAVQYTAPDHQTAIIFAFRRSHVFGTPLPPLRLQSLDETGHYDIKHIDVSAAMSSGKSMGALSGAALMACGLPLPLEPGRSFASCLIYISCHAVNSLKEM